MVLCPLIKRRRVTVQTHFETNIIQRIYNKWPFMQFKWTAGQTKITTPYSKAYYCIYYITLGKVG